jgi:hypothetical protein
VRWRDGARGSQFNEAPAGSHQRHAQRRGRRLLRPNPTVHILRISCGELFDIVATDVAETGHERVEQPFAKPLNPHVEKPEFAQATQRKSNY